MIALAGFVPKKWDVCGDNILSRDKIVINPIYNIV